MNNLLDLRHCFVLLLIINESLCVDDTNFSETHKNSVKVELELGTVEGKVEKTTLKNQDYYSFKGIPFAAAPVGKLRFKPPTPHLGWPDTLEAFENKPTCMQFSARMRLDEPFGISGSEDCLFISIFTPNLKKRLPVIIFDYNDSFKTAFNGTDAYSPENFLEEDVIVVTISHRLGIFGYLTTDDEVIPGNNGLRDFIFGLQWVKENIERFGGDPNKVTLMGSCSSGALVNMLIYSEKAKELFSGAIIQSGSAFDPTYFYKDTKTKAFQLGEQYDVQTNDSAVLLETLQKPEPEDLFNKLIKVLMKIESARENQLTVQPFGPVLESDYPDAVLTALPEDANIVNDVPVLIGFNSREGLDYVSHFLFDPRLLSPDADEGMLQFPIRTGFRFERESKAFKEATQELLNLYFGSKIVDYNSLLEYGVYAGDILVGYSQNYAARQLSASLKSSVFYYLFDFRGQLNVNFQYLTRYSRVNLNHWGATVLDELCYLHICSKIKRDYVELTKMASEQKELKVLKKMVRMWTNFAKTGNPTPARDSLLNDFIWSPTSKGSQDLEYLHITKSLKMDVNPLGERTKFWDEFLKKYAERAVNGVVIDEEQIKDEL